MSQVSVVIPALNEADNIECTLKPLQAFRRQGWEILLVDGGSVDATCDKSVALVDRLLTAPAGRARQMNAGASEARGSLLWFLHADTVIGPDAGGQLLHALNNRVQWGRFDIRLSGQPWALRLIERTINIRSRLSGITTGDQGIFVSRALFHEIGGFPDIPLMEDIAISKRLKHYGRPCCLPGPLVTSSRRWERFGIWRTVLLMQRLRLAYFFGADPAQLHRRYYG